MASVLAMTGRWPAGHHAPQLRRFKNQCANENEHNHNSPIKQEQAVAALYAANGGEMSGDNHHQREEQRFWRRYLLVSWAAVFAATAAACFAAGAFTQARRQADTAQDQEIRSLRAYVSIEAAPAATPDDEDLPSVLVKVENVGQTPAYRMFISSPVTVSGRGETPNIGYKGEDCAYITETAVGGLSLARTPFQERFGVGLSQAPRARAAVASGIYEVRAKILVCYRDVFNAVRHVRVCRRYFNGWDHTIPCDGEQDEHD